MTNIATNNLSFQTLLNNLVENILRYADSPAKSAEYITSQIRELVGVRLVALVSLDELTGCNLLSICPSRKEAEWNKPEIQSFVANVLSYKAPHFIDPITDPDGKVLSAIGIGKSFVIPLKVGVEKVGMLVLLDLMDEGGDIKSILYALTQASTVLALILKNSLLYKNLELTVEIRTEQLAKSEKLFRALFEQSAVGVAQMETSSGRFVQVNRKLCDILGYSQEEILKMDYTAITHPDDLQESIDNNAQLQSNGIREFSIDKRYICKDGNTKWVNVSVSPMWQEDENRDLYMAVVIDITERKKAETEKQAFEQQIQHTQKLESLGVLAGGIAHDFNNILAIIMGYCSLTKMDYETAEQNIQEIEKATERAAGLCSQMLAYAGKAQLSMSQINMWTLVDEMVNMLKATLPQNAVIKPELSTNIPFITADASQIRQIVMNLIINASEAIGKNQGEIRVLLTKATVIAGQSEKDYHGKEIQPGGYVCLEVTDTGCGMDDETKWRIFEPFYTTKFTGRGLGMSAVLGIINSHNGALQLFTQIGQGTTFKVYLPVQLSNTKGESYQNLSVPAEPWKGTGTVLLVEDEYPIRNIANKLLTMFGFTVLEAVNGKEALALYQKNAAEITLVLTDMGMPVMDGYALCSALKQLNPKLPIIISSGFGDADVISRIGHDNIAGIINKPYNPNQLREVLKSALEGAR